MSIFLTILIGTALFIACQNKHALENNDHTPDPIIEDNIPPVTDGFFVVLSLTSKRQGHKDGYGPKTIALRYLKK